LEIKLPQGKGLSAGLSKTSCFINMSEVKEQITKVQPEGWNKQGSRQAVPDNIVSFIVPYSQRGEITEIGSAYFDDDGNEITVIHFSKKVQLLTVHQDC
jgi:hypothetical protein